LPAVLALRRRFPASLIEIAGNASALPLAETAGVADRWLSFDDPRVTRLFMPGHPAPDDYFLGLSAAVAWCADPDGALEAGLRARGAEHVLLAPSRPPVGQTLHVAEYLLRSLGAFPAAPDDVAAQSAAPEPAIELPPHVPPAWASDAADAALAAANLAGRLFLVVHPGSGSAAKNWPPERFAAVVPAVEARLGLPSVMLAGPADDAVIQRLRHAAPVLPPILADLPLPVVAALLLRARGYLGNDSGVAHLAGQLGLPTLVLFGPTDPALWRPLGPRVQVLRATPLADLTVETALAALVPLLAG
jgi:hypothetical protein